MQGLTTFEAELCECGWHKSLTHDKANHFTYTDDMCPVCAGAQRYGRIVHKQEQDLIEKRGDKAPPGQPLPSDGRRTYSRMQSAEEVAAKRQS